MDNQYKGIFDNLDFMLIALGSSCTVEQGHIVLKYAKENLPAYCWAGVADRLDDICSDGNFYYHISENMAERGITF